MDWNASSIYSRKQEILKISNRVVERKKDEHGKKNQRHKFSTNTAMNPIELFEYYYGSFKWHSTSGMQSKKQD